MKKRMLVVDDSKINRSLLVEIFKGEYDVFQASDGKEALDTLLSDEKSFSIVVLDLIMPVMDGYELLTVMRSTKALEETPVIVLSSSDDTDSELKALNHGADDMITKPFDPRIIRQRVKNIVLKAELAEVKVENAKLKKQTQDQLHLQAIMDNMIGGIVFIDIADDSSGYLLYRNRGFYELFGYTPEGYAAHNPNIFLDVYPQDREQIHTAILDAIENHTSFSRQIRMFDGNSEVQWIHIQGVEISYEESKNHVIMAIMENITEQKLNEQKIELANKELRYRADHDQLTGIYNREKFFRKTEELLREDPESTYVFLKFNVRKFKLINEIYGVGTGDSILIALAKYMDQVLFDKHASYGRIAGDHFAACVRRGDFNIDAVVTEIDAKLSEICGDVHIVVEAGIYVIDDPTMPAANMFDRASLALQNVTEDISSNYAYYDDKIRETLLREQEIIGEMSLAVEQHQFVIFLQPVISLAKQDAVSAEALVRWRHPTKGLISPGLFIPLFERNGFITKLDYYVWEEVCRYIKQRADRGLPPISISVNASRRSIYSLNICRKICDLCDKYGVDPSLLKLEITESAYTDTPAKLIKTTAELQSAGFTVLMDDFGSGYSSLNTLKDLPVDVLKIDMKFLEDFETSKRTGNIVTSIIRMAKWLDMAVIAEGVETAQQIDFLRSVGCDRIQSYYFSKPLPLDEFEAKGYGALSGEELRKPSDSDIVLHPIDFDEIFSGNAATNRLLNSLAGGLGLYEFMGSSLELIKTNSTYYDILGFDTDSVDSYSSNVHKLVFEDDVEKSINACRAVIATGKSQRITVRHYHHNGNLVYLDCVYNYLGGTDECPLICISFNDITERFLLKSKEDDYRAYLESIMSAVPGGIVLYEISPDKVRAIYFNDTAAEIAGCTREEYAELYSN